MKPFEGGPVVGGDLAHTTNALIGRHPFVMRACECWLVKPHMLHLAFNAKPLPVHCTHVPDPAVDVFARLRNGFLFPSHKLHPEGTISFYFGRNNGTRLSIHPTTIKVGVRRMI